MDREGRTPQAAEQEKCEADGWLGWDGLMGRSYFPTKPFSARIKKAKKDQVGLKPGRWTPQRNIPKKCSLGDSHPGAVSTGANPKAWLAQNPKGSVEKPGMPFLMPD